MSRFILLLSTTILALLKNHVNCYFPSELSCQMASNAFSNRVFVNIWGHIEKPLLLLSNVNILCGNCFWQHSTSRGDNKSYFRKCGKNRWKVYAQIWELRDCYCRKTGLQLSSMCLVLLLFKKLKAAAPEIKSRPCENSLADFCTSESLTICFV